MQSNFLVTLLLCVSICISCSKIDESAFEDIPTELEVTVLDNAGNPVTEAEVFLYRDRSSMDSRTGWSNRDTTNEAGVATFTNLEPAQYFIYTHHENGNVVYDNYKESFRIPVLLRESSLTKLEVATQASRPVNPTVVRILGIHYPFDFDTDQNDASCWLQSRIIINNQSNISFSNFHIYEYGKILLWNDDQSQALDPLYAEMEDIFPFSDDGYNLLISNVQSIQNNYTLALDHTNRTNVLSNSIFFNLDEIIDEAVNHKIPYPNRMRVGTTNTGHDELEFDIILEWL